MSNKKLNRRQENNLLLSDISSFRSYINDNGITEFTLIPDLSIDDAHQVAIWLGDSGQVKKLQIAGTVLLTVMAQIIFRALATNTTITYLNLYVEIEDLAALTHLLKENKGLQKISFTGNHLGSSGLKAIADGLKENRTLHKLNLSDNSITKAADQTRDLSGLQLLLDNNIHVTELYINVVNIGQDGANIIGSWLGTNPPLQKLTISYSSISNMNGISTGLQTNYNLYELDLDKNNLSNSDFNILAQTLQVNETLQYLYLPSNNIDDYDADLIVESAKFLRKLDLSNNDITDYGVIAFATVLSNNNTMTDLSLADNKIGDEGAEQLAKILEVNTTLDFLNLHGNKIGDEGAEFLYQAIKYNATMILTVDENNIHDYDLIDLIDEKNRVNEHNNKLNSLTLIQILQNYEK